MVPQTTLVRHRVDAFVGPALALGPRPTSKTPLALCRKGHLQNARKKGFAQNEIDEAARMGIRFAGSPAMLFYEPNRDC